MFDLTYIIIVIAVILVSMTLHEAMHAFMSYWLGDDTAKAQGRLTLNPIKHIDPFLTLALPVLLALVGAPIFGGARPVPFNPALVRGGEWGAAFVAVAGPLTNFLIAFVAFGVGIVAFGHPFANEIVAVFVMVNIGFFVFNMLPIPPLDGSRVLYALAPEFVRRVMEGVERMGIFIIFALVLLFSPQLGQIMGGAMQIIVDLFNVIFRL